MRVLFVVPVEVGSGEIVTCLHIGQRCVAAGDEILFLASQFGRRFLEPVFGTPRVAGLTTDGAANLGLWASTLEEFRPDAIVFADYPLLFFGYGVTPLAEEPGWVESLETVEACLVTLDHFGFAQRAMRLFVGPPHLTSQSLRFPAIPEGMRILLPCPMHEPGSLAGRRGEPFRYWDVPLAVSPARREAVRRKYLGARWADEALVFHSVSNWAWQSAEAFDLPLYRFMPRLLDDYFAGASRPVTIVSVNNGRLMQAAPGSRVRIVNLAPLPALEFESLVLSADLMLTDNRISISMGKAICGLQTCAALKNSYRLLEILADADPPTRDVVLAMERARRGSVFPHEVYPSDLRQALDDLVLYRENSLTRAFKDVELYGGASTRATLTALLDEGPLRRTLRERAEAYVERLRGLPDSASVLRRIVAEHREEREATV